MRVYRRLRESQNEVRENFRDDMQEAIAGVFEKYNFTGEYNFNKKDLDNVIRLMEVHGFFDDPDEWA